MGGSGTGWPRATSASRDARCRVYSRRFIRALLAVLMLACLLGCSDSGRSTEAFCDTFESEALRLVDEYSSRLDGIDAESDPLGALVLALGSILEAQGDLVVLLDRLEAVAPDEIQPEVEAVRDALKDQADAAGEALSDPLAALGSGLAAGLTSMGSVTAIESYIRDNCDLSFLPDT